MTPSKDSVPSTPAPEALKTKPATQDSAPIALLDNPLARTYSYAHIAVVLSSFAYSFSSLVVDPVNTLFGSLVPLAILQTLYVVVCLPGTNAKYEKPGSVGQGKGKKKSQQHESMGLGLKVVPALLSLLLTIALSTPLLFLTLILFGAPLITHTPHTLLCAAHLALLATPPLFYVHGVDASLWRRIASLDLPVDEVFGATLGTAVGAWVGAVPIPLDWDREWQRWPVTVVAGAYGGWALGKVVGGTLAKGGRISLE